MSFHSQSRRRALLLSLFAGVLSGNVALADTPLETVNVTDYFAQDTITETTEKSSGGEVAQVTALQEYGSSTRQAVPQPQPLRDTAPPAGSSTRSSVTVVPEGSAPYQAAPTYQAGPEVSDATAADEKKKAAADAAKKAYKGLFFDNNFGYLDDSYDGPSRPGDRLKGLFNGRLDLGGEYRVRYHNETNFRGLGLTGNDDNFFLSRLRLFANYNITENLRIYGEYLYADSAGENLGSPQGAPLPDGGVIPGGGRPIEENRGEIQNLFVEAKLTDNLSVAVGRQELLLGSQRLISPLDFANTRRTFQGVSGTYQGENWIVDAWWTNPVNRVFANDSTIDDANEDIDFYGVYGSRKTKTGNFDLYYIGQVNDAPTIPGAVDDASFQTIGSWLFGKTKNDWLYDIEGGVQFGQTSTGSGRGTGFITTGIGRQLSIKTPNTEWKPTVWLYYDWADGDDQVPASQGDNGFEQHQPLGHKYLGFLDLFGRRNINDVNLLFTTPFFSKRVKLIVWLHHFFLDEETTPFNVTGTPFFANVNTDVDRELGQEIDILFNIGINERNNIQVGYSFFNSGGFYETAFSDADDPAGSGTPSQGDASFFYAHYQTRF